MEGISLESIIDESKNGNGRFTLDTDLRDFVKGIEYETDLPPQLKLLMLNHGYKNWKSKGFDTIRDLILSYRNGVSNWSEKSRKVLNCTLTKYGFQELAPKKYARS
ncbi:MAG: hypothetical protein V1762_00715 [Nitrospirota bacterium]